MSKKPVPKPRRDFRAWLLHQMIQQGAELPDDPPYKLVREVLAQRGLRPTEGPRA